MNLLSESDWSKVKAQFDRNEAALYDIQTKSNQRILAYASNKPLKIKWIFKAWVDVPNSSKPTCFAKFFVVEGGAKSILSRRTAIGMKLLKLGLEVCEVTATSPSEVKEPFPAIPGKEIEFDIDLSVTPTKHGYYHVPAAYSKRAKERLDDMEAQDIIEKVEGAPKWISGMSAVPKGKDDFRLVVNMKGPNKAIRRQFHHIPTFNEMKRKLHGAKYFSKLDIKSAFYHVKIAPASRDLTTFMTENGMYRFKRLVFGVNCAPELFQREMERVLRGLMGALVFIDDILIYASTRENLKKQTAAVLKRLQENNLTLNSEKCEYELEELTFLGHRLSQEGFSMDQAKVEAIGKFREPKTSSELRSFLGLATYVSTFIPNFSSLTSPLWKSATTRHFEWSEKQRESFALTKQAIINCTVSQGFFSDTDETSVYTDASPSALGAVLVQTNEEGESRIISFASKSLSPTEQRYAQTQREALGIVWAVEHFYYFLLGRHFTIKTDAQGISFIFQREKETAKRVLSRAEGWALRLSAYDFSVEYIKGHYNIADPSSRLYEGIDEHYVEGKGACEIATIDSLVYETSFDSENLTIKNIGEASAVDETFRAVRSALQTGEWSESLNRFRAVKDQLSVQADLIVKDGALVLPIALRETALSVAHRGHPGETAMKSILRARLWWPGMTRDTEDWVKSCRSCTLMSRRDPPVPMTRAKLPKDVWETIAVDFNGPYARFGGILILVMVDCYSRYLITAVVKSTDWQSLEKVLVHVFNERGNPKTVKSDNGPPFMGADYKKFCAERSIMPEYSTPLHPQQNGMAERYMQIVNKAMQIAALEGKPYTEELANGVRAHNSAKHRVTQVAPEELMYKRKIRRDLPLIGSTEVAVDDDELRARDTTEKMKAKVREDEKRRAVGTKIAVGDTVVVLKTARAKGDPKFDPTPFTVTAKNRGDLDLQADDGRLTKRNVTHVKKLRTRQQDRVHLQPNEPECNGPVAVQPQGVQGADDQAPLQMSSQNERDQAHNLLRRSTRQTKPPRFLDMYVRMIKGMAE